MSENILKELAAYSSKRAEEDRKTVSLETLKNKIEFGEIPERKPFGFESKLSEDGISFICEIKKASPSKGIISEDFPYIKIAEEYENAGADCISCLTEPERFLGSDKIFSDIRNTTNLPMIRKDFITNEYQIYQSKVMGADAVLLITALLDENELKRYLKLCDELSMSALVETHNADEIKTATNSGARIIGVNNRNLKDFSVDAGNCLKLRRYVPENVLFVAESGIKTAKDISELKKERVDAVLIGETVMRSEDKNKCLMQLRGIQ